MKIVNTLTLSLLLALPHAALAETSAMPNPASQIDQSVMTYAQSCVSKLERMEAMQATLERRPPASGDLLLVFELMAGGQVSKLNLLASSGHAVLDQAAMRAVQRASPFASLPAPLKNQGKAIRIQAKFSYRSNVSVTLHEAALVTSPMQP